MHDFLVAGGLNGRVDVDSLAALAAVAYEASDAIESLGRSADVAFWDLEAEELAALDAAPEASLEETVRLERESRVWGLYRAWYVLMSATHVGLALAHKVLHHKLPRLRGRSRCPCT